MTTATRTSTEPVDVGGAFLTTALALVVAVPVFFMLAVISAVGVFYETWVAMTIWSWFAPWPLPFGLIAAVGMNIAVSIIFRSGKRAKDERTTKEIARDGLEHAYLVPSVALGVAWLIQWWFL